ncbi:MAG TPA: PLP-dependent aminotransferase family protein [Jatrophihabitans sp.]|nr:PLP-dependent aminotransferase family protein [Jatrophihabitans sp.]
MIGEPISTAPDFLLLDASAAPPRGRTSWLVAELRAAIADGRLPEGRTLPASRALAAELGLARGVVVAAYQRLADEGLIGGRQGAGTVVLNAPGERPVTGRPRPSTGLRLPVARLPSGAGIDLSPGVPDLSAFPRAGWQRAERAVLAECDAGEFGYGDPRGAEALRVELSGWLGRTRGLRVHPDDIVIVAGVAQALALVARALLARGIDSMAVEDPGSRGALDQLRWWGIRPVPVPVDEAGLQVDRLRRTRAPAVLVTPAHQFPTGFVLAPERRRDLLDWAADAELIVEDDYDAEYRYDRAPVPALHASAPERIAYTGSTSKTLAPGLRLGWLIPPPHLHDAIVAAKHAADLGSPTLPQLTLARLLANGQYERHVRLMRARHRARRDALAGALRAVLPDTRIQGVAAGLHLLITLRAGVDDVALAERLRAAGVQVHPLSWHRVRPGTPGLVLGYAGQPPDRLREAAAVVARAVVSAR